MEVSNGTLRVQGVQRRVVYDNITPKPEMWLIEVLSLTAPDHCGQAENSDLVFHWIKGHDHLRSVFNLRDHAMDAWENLADTYREKTNSVAGLKINERELFLARREYFTICDLAGAYVSGTPGLTGPLLYPFMPALIKNTMVAVPVATPKGMGVSFVIRLHLPLRNGEVHRNYLLQHTAHNPPGETDPSRLMDWMQKQKIKAVTELTQSVYNILSRKTITYVITGNVAQPDQGHRVVGHQQLSIGIGYLAYRPSVVPEQEAIALYDETCFETVDGKMVPQARTLKEYAAAPAAQAELLNSTGGNLVV
jgi:hypothetical protein